MSSQPESSTQEVLAGLVERVTYHNADNGFCVLRAKARGHRDLVTVVGHAATIAAGEWITASGEWVNDRTHGQQFKARFLRTSAPSTVDGIEKYLASGMIRGIGPVYAKKLVRVFGHKVFDVIEAEPDRLCEVEGIGPVPAVSRPPGPSRRSCTKSWFFFTAMASARHGRCASSRPMVPMPSRS
jgi:exodeoxyribonuclease V alpha subunit